VDGILVSQPIRPFDRIVHVPSPIVFVHVAEGGIDPSLSSDSMASCREELRYTSGVESRFGQTKGCTQTRSAGADDNGVIFVVLEKSISQGQHQQGGGVHTMTGYLLLTKGEASLARRGRLVTILPGKATRQQLRSGVHST
jgi:hypothetical protein